MDLTFILKYLEIQFATACFSFVSIFFQNEAKNLSAKVLVDTVSQGNIFRILKATDREAVN